MRFILLKTIWGVMEEGMGGFKCLRPIHRDDDHILALSFYNEGFATAVRKGAPSASYSIDRKGLQQYMLHLTYSDTATLVCFTCARKFPFVHGAKKSPIRRHRVLSHDEMRDQSVQVSFWECHNDRLTTHLD